MSNIPSMQDLLEAGVHFGHQVRRWNPKMAKYIFGAREGIHLLDLEQTVKALEAACDFARSVGEVNGTFIFLASKKQARAIVAEEAEKCGAKYMVERWVGGLLTNFEQTSKTVKNLADLKSKKETGEYKERTKKENLMIDRDIARLERVYGGLVGMEKLPDALFVIDVKKEENACREAKARNIPIVAVCDTNANLTLVDFPIPGNDDATRAISILTQAIGDAYLEGRKVYEKKSALEKVAADKAALKEAAKKEKEEAAAVN